MAATEIRPLILRSNRFLGTWLVEKKLVTLEQLESANEKLLEYVQQDDLRRANLLHVLLFEMQALDESRYLDAVVEQCNVGLMDLRTCQFRKVGELKPDLAACWATGTVPFDLADDFHLLATVIYPSQPAVKFWQDKYAGTPIQWYATTVRSLQAALERLEVMKGEAAKAAPRAPSGRTNPPHPPAAKGKSGGTPLPRVLASKTTAAAGEAVKPGRA